MTAGEAPAQDVPRRAPVEVHEAAPALGWYTDHILFHRIWNRPELGRRERSLVTLSALTTNGQSPQLTGHINLALDHGVAPAEIVELITHLAFYAGWPAGMSALTVMRTVFAGRNVTLDAGHQSLPFDSGAPVDRGEGAAALLSECVEQAAADALWDRPELGRRDRRIATISSVIAGGQWDELPAQLRAAANDGVTPAELREIVVHLAYYAGLPKARKAAAILDGQGPQ